jgi:hypothetical protein
LTAEDEAVLADFFARATENSARKNDTP